MSSEMTASSWIPSDPPERSTRKASTAMRRLCSSVFILNMASPTTTDADAARNEQRPLHIDRLYGSDRLRRLLDDGKDADQIVSSWDTSRFEALRARVVLYA